MNEPNLIRLKCRLNGEIRIVSVNKNTEYNSLKRRLSSDYGFDVSLKYEDKDGDNIILASQNDLNDMFDNIDTNTVNVIVSENVTLPNLQLKSITKQNSGILNTNSIGASKDWIRSSSSSISHKPHTCSRSDRFPSIDSNNSSRYQEIEIKWKKGEILGQGAFGVVFLGLNTETGELMAVKQMSVEEVSKKELSSLENEINLLRTLRHPNIVRYIGTEINDVAMSIFLEYVPGGSLKALIDKFGQLDESVTKSYTRQLLLGLEYLHRNGIAHRDIKGANCLVGNDGVIKLADFGNSKKWRSGTVQQGSSSGINLSTGHPSGDIKGTPSWMAPEVIKDQGKNISWKKADIWSLACTTLEMSTGKPPWNQFNNPVTILYHIACQDTLPAYPSPASMELITFLNACFQRDPKLRPDVTSLLLHPFVTSLFQSGVNWNSSSVGNTFLLRPTTMSSAYNVNDWDMNSSSNWSNGYRIGTSTTQISANKNNEEPEIDRNHSIQPPSPLSVTPRINNLDVVDKNIPVFPFYHKLNDEIDSNQEQNGTYYINGIKSSESSTPRINAMEDAAYTNLNHSFTDNIDLEQNSEKSALMGSFNPVTNPEIAHEKDILPLEKFDIGKHSKTRLVAIPPIESMHRAKKKHKKVRKNIDSKKNTENQTQHQISGPEVQIGSLALNTDLNQFTVQNEFSNCENIKEKSPFQSLPQNGMQDSTNSYENQSITKRPISINETKGNVPDSLNYFSNDQNWEDNDADSTTIFADEDSRSLEGIENASEDRTDHLEDSLSINDAIHSMRGSPQTARIEFRRNDSSKKKVRKPNSGNIITGSSTLHRSHNSSTKPTKAINTESRAPVLGDEPPLQSIEFGKINFKDEMYDQSFASLSLRADSADIVYDNEYHSEMEDVDHVMVKSQDISFEDDSSTQLEKGRRRRVSTNKEKLTDSYDQSLISSIRISSFSRPHTKSMDYALSPNSKSSRNKNKFASKEFEKDFPDDISCDSLDKMSLAGNSHAQVSQSLKSKEKSLASSRYSKLNLLEQSVENFAPISSATSNFDFSKLVNCSPQLLEEHTAAVTRIRAPANTNLLVSSSLDGTIKIWSQNSNTSILTLEGLSFMSNPRTADAESRPERKISLGHKTSESSETAPASKQLKMTNVWVDENGESIWGVGSDYKVRVWNGSEGKAIRLLKGHEDSITAMEGVDSGYNSSFLMSTGSSDRTVRIWDLRAKKSQVFLFRGHGDSILALRWGESGRSLVSSSKDKTIRIWDTRAGRLRTTLEKHFSSVSSIRVCSESQMNKVFGGQAQPQGTMPTLSITNTNREMPYVISAGRDSMVNVWSSNGDCISSQTAHRGPVTFLSEINYQFNIRSSSHPCSPAYITLGADGIIKLWDLKKYRSIVDFQYNQTHSSQGNLSKAIWLGNSFVTASTSGAVKLYEYNPSTSIDNVGLDGSEPNSENLLEAPAYTVPPTRDKASIVSDWVCKEMATHTNSVTDLIGTSNFVASSSRSGQILRWNF